MRLDRQSLNRERRVGLGFSSTKRHVVRLDVLRHTLCCWLILQVSVDKYKKEAKERKRLHNIIVELKGNIRVFCRVRPVGDREVKSGFENVCEVPSEAEITVWNEQTQAHKFFEFDQVRPSVGAHGIGVGLLNTTRTGECATVANATRCDRRSSTFGEWHSATVPLQTIRTLKTLSALSREHCGVHGVNSRR